MKEETIIQIIPALKEDIIEYMSDSGDVTGDITEIICWAMVRETVVEDRKHVVTYTNIHPMVSRLDGGYGLEIANEIHTISLDGVDYYPHITRKI